MKKIFWLVLAIIALKADVAYTQRTYSYTCTVGNGKDFTTINDGIEAIAKNELSEEKLGCIYVYPGTYVEQINSFYPRRE